MERGAINVGRVHDVSLLYLGCDQKQSCKEEEGVLESHDFCKTQNYICVCCVYIHKELSSGMMTAIYSVLHIYSAEDLKLSSYLTLDQIECEQKNCALAKLSSIGTNGGKLL